MDDNLAIDINLEDVDDGTEPIPDGMHICRVVSVARKQKEGSEYPYFEITLKPNDFPSKKLWLNLSLNPKALWNLKLFSKAMGLDLKRPDLASVREKEIGVEVGVEPARNDPDRKVNVVKAKYHAVS